VWYASTDPGNPVCEITSTGVMHVYTYKSLALSCFVLECSSLGTSSSHTLCFFISRFWCTVRLSYSNAFFVQSNLAPFSRSFCIYCIMYKSEEKRSCCVDVLLLFVTSPMCNVQTEQAYVIRLSGKVHNVGGIVILAYSKRP
jgi:hypothetical protein